MPQTGGGFQQAYNAQASVDIESMIVVTTHGFLALLYGNHKQP